MEKDYVTLYRYERINDDLIKTIEKGRIKLSSGESFNDPFDLTFIQKKSIKKFNGLFVYCLTNSFKNRLMWAHYAGKHSGVCLTIMVPKDIVYPVCYSNDRVIKKEDAEKIFKKSKFEYCKKNIKENICKTNNKTKMALIKDKIWQYEKEYRVIIQKNTNSEVYLIENEYVNCKIKNIYIGAKFDKNEEKNKKILRICKKNKITVTEVGLSNEKYKLEFKQQKNIK